MAANAQPIRGRGSEKCMADSRKCQCTFPKFIAVNEREGVGRA